MSNDLMIIEDNTVFKMEVDFNKAREWAIGLCEKYSNLVIQEEDVASIKKEMAELNKYAKDIDESRKGIEKKYKDLIAPYIDQIKSVKSIFDNTYTTLKSQVDVFEQKQRDDRRKEIEDIIAGVIKENSFESRTAAFNIQEKWLNKTTTKKSIISDLTEIVSREKQAIAAEEERQRLEKERLDAIQSTAKNIKEEMGVDMNIGKFAVSNKPLAEIIQEMNAEAKVAFARIKNETAVKENLTAEAPKPQQAPAETTPPAENWTGLLKFNISGLVDMKNKDKVISLLQEVKSLCVEFENL